MRSSYEIRRQINRYEKLIDEITFENKEGIMEYDEYSKMLEIYYHKISLLEWVLKENKVYSEIKFNMMNGEKRKIELPYKYMILMLESLNNFKSDIENCNVGEILSKMKFQYKLEEVNDLINIIENKTEYKFNKRLEKCKCKNNKKNDHIGLDGIEAVFNIKNNFDKDKDKNDIKNN